MATGKTVFCGNCKFEFDESLLFCGKCGLKYGDEDQQWVRIEPFVQGAIERALDNRLTDQKVVEVEITELIAERMIKWSKLFLYVAGALFLLGGGVLTLAGIHSYSAFVTDLNAAQADVISNAKKNVAPVDQEVEALKAKISSDLQFISQSRTDYERLAQRLNVVEKSAVNPLTIRYTSDPNALVLLQQKLQQDGFFTGPATGKFDAATIAAVAAFQKRNGLKDDGAPGPQTLSKLGLK